MIIDDLAAGRSVSVVDIGGGASRLADAGISRGWRMTVLDVSANAIELSKSRLGPLAGQVNWIVGDVTRWQPASQVDIWHDRAAFHFLTMPEQRAAYAQSLRASLAHGAHAVIATFAPDGPERCSGLPVQRYDGPGLAAALGPGVCLEAEHRRTHITPWGGEQRFQFSVLKRV